MSSPPRGENDAVKVAVRVRPLNDREKGSVVCVKMDRKSCWTEEDKKGAAQVAEVSTGLRQVGKVGGTAKQASGRFQFDHCLYSIADGSREKIYSQLDVYNEVGAPLLTHVFKGYNVCLFAYGQTGSGKTHTMMGDISKPNLPNAGIIPRLCTDMFERIEKKTNESTSFVVHASYIELYNEQVCDLLAKELNPDLKVREDPRTGPFVQGLKMDKVSSVDGIIKLIVQGNKQRHVAATKMNAESSRSHAILTLYFEEEAHGEDMEGVAAASRVNLVDLAGSESINKSGVSGINQIEAININLSLTTLRKVIDSLSNPKKGLAPPYRDSKLTYLLKDSLGNNAKTCMVATVSPSLMNISETKNTLHYASLARAIQNSARANADENIRLVQDLQNELAELRDKLTGHSFFTDKGLTPEKLQAMEAELALKQEQEAQLKSKVEQLNLERQLKSKQEEELLATKEEKQRLHNERLALEQRLSEGKDKETKLSENVKDLTSNFEASKQQLAEQQERLDELVKHKTELEEEQRRRAEYRKQLEQEGADKDKRLEAADEEIKTLKDRIQGLERELENTVTDLNASEDALTEAEDNVLSLREAKSTISDELKTVTARNAELEDELLDLQEQLAATLAELETLRETLHKTQADLSDKTEESSQRLAKLEETSEELEATKKTVTEKTQESDERQNKLNETTTELEATKTNLSEKTEECSKF
eukprot:TRINITY_DN513_c1_g1_i3.p1 TRINITY_DN513_c1_g1~~TRINITY_DN513_c1_g1_i3.p1  ORF type:complete len:786 (+),score=270.30 TRINITY_DN513_c1_g1_i3:230-2359(+)